MRFDEWLSALAYTDFPDDLFTRQKAAGTRPYASEIEEMLTRKRGIDAAAVFCVGELPTICLIDGPELGDLREDRVEQIRQRVWNQNLVSVVLVLDPDRLAAYSVNSREAEPEIISSSEINREGRWSAFEVQSGFIKDRLSNWFEPDSRVDRRLLANLHAAVQQLSKAGISIGRAEALMAQVVFLCYLEQRKIIGDDYRRAHRLDVLDAYVARQDGAAVDRLLRRLGSDFNGDFLTSHATEAPGWETLKHEHFVCIKTFLDAVDFDTGQGTFWRYDFSHIPVELISGIYESLLKERRGKLGAYYTPRHLANVVVEQAFEGMDDPSSLTVYDGACGSGILLTTAYRKMLRHAEVRDRRRLSLRERISLMRAHIFGGDVDETACWITAFSLYLSLLEGLEPADIVLLQTDKQLTLPPLVGARLNIQKGAAHGDFFSARNPYSASKQFDIFICNPPWRESRDEEMPLWEEWLRSREQPYPIGRRQIAAGFAYRATSSVKPDGRIVLIMPLNLMIGATHQSTQFRQRWLEEVQIERVINFGDVRRLLFPESRHPCAVVRVRPRAQDEEIVFPTTEVIEYWTPKTDVSLALGRLALYAIDRKQIRSVDAYEMPYLFISSYWGEERDLDLLRRLQKLGTVKGAMISRRKPWISGKGFHAANKSNPDRELGILERLPFLPVERLPSEYPVISADVQLDLVRDHFDIVASPGGRNGQLYEGPRVLFPDGLLERCGVRAVYSNVPFAFQSSIGAIGGGAKDKDLLKFMTAYLRSPLASYVLLMTGYSVIGERPRVALDDIESFPFCAPESHPRPSVARGIVKNVASVFDRIAKASEWQREHAYRPVRKELDALVFEYFGISANDKILIDDAVQFIAASIQPSDYSALLTPLLHRPSQIELQRYVDVLVGELASRRDRRHGKGRVAVEAVVADTTGFLGAVRIAKDAKGSDRATVVNSAPAFRQLLSEMEQALQAQAEPIRTEDLLKVPNITVLAGDAFYFVKPLRRRFWLGKAALRDADQIVGMVQSAAWDRAYK
jgi:hypothetical protein